MGSLPGGMGEEDTLVPLPPREVTDQIPRAFSRIVECTAVPCSLGFGEDTCWQEGQLAAPHRVTLPM